MNNPFSLSIVDLKGDPRGEYLCDEQVFGVNVDESVVHRVVRWQMSKRRQGTHYAKTRTFVCRSKAKPWKQKGTGRARAGSRTSPHWVGGGVAHGPLPRDYTHKLPRQVRRAALCLVIARRIEQGKVVVVDSFEGMSGKTKEFAEMMGRTVPGARSLLVVAHDNFDSIRRASRNLQKVKSLKVEGLNVMDIVSSDRILVDRESLELITSRLRGSEEMVIS